MTTPSKIHAFSETRFTLQRQYEVSYLGLAIGAIFTLGGLLAWMATKNTPFRYVHLLRQIGEKNSYFILAGGSSLTLLSVAALFHLERKEKRIETTNPDLQPE